LEYRRAGSCGGGQVGEGRVGDVLTASDFFGHVCDCISPHLGRNRLYLSVQGKNKNITQRVQFSLNSLDLSSTTPHLTST
jgi:hypothetical protein